MSSRVLFFILSLFVVYCSFQYFPRWKEYGSESVISWDVSGYYWYLPSALITHDMKHLSNKDSLIRRYAPATDFQQAFKADNGNYVFKYGIGMSVMFLPAFTVAHLLAPVFGYSADGFSPPYQLALQIQAILAFLLGLWFFRKLLLYYYADKVVAICMALLVIGTNYLNYVAFDGSMTHNYIFTLYVFILLATRSFYLNPGFKKSLILGLLIGLAMLIRPTEIIAWLIPLLWGINTVPALKERFVFIGKRFGLIVVALVAAFLVYMIQISYWKYVSGHWLVYSYQNQGFSFNDPHLADYTFSFQSGWLVYTPMMMLSVIGLIRFIRKGNNRPMVIVFSLVAYYIVASWDVWWYGGRAMVQYYPVIFFILASFIEGILTRGKILKSVTIFVILVFTYVNIWWTLQAHAGVFWPGGPSYSGGLFDGNNMNNHYFWRVIGRLHAPEITKTLLDASNLYEGEPKDTLHVYQNNFDSLAGGNVFVDKTHENSDSSSFPYSHYEYKWIRVQATFRCTVKEWDVWKMPQFCADMFAFNHMFRREAIRVDRFLDNGLTRTLYFDIKLKGQRPERIKVFLWNPGSDKALYMDSLKVWAFNS